MAITSVGYSGTVGEQQWAALAPSLGGKYGVAAAGHWRVSTVAGADRTVKIAVGSGFGHGVYDTSDAEITVQAEPLASGTRWDLVVVHRDWAGSGGTTSFAIVEGTSVQTAVFALRDQSPGVVDEQPLALVQITAGSTVPTQVIDLRVWQANGGASAASSLALQYLDEVGTEVWVGTDVWHRYVDSSGSATWGRSSMSSVPLLGFGPQLVGTTPTSATDFKIQAGTFVASTDNAGYARITFPTPFLNGVLSVVISAGDQASNPNKLYALGWAPGFPTYSKDYAVFTVREASTGALMGSYPIRANWIAIGW